MKTRTMVVMLVACLLLGACGGSDEKVEAGAADAPGECGTHEAITAPDWLPADLPLPKGTEVIEISEATSGFAGVTLTHPGSIEAFREFVAAEWDAAGYTILDSEHEAAEAEGEFTKDGHEGWYKTVQDGCATQSVTFLRFEA